MACVSEEDSTHNGKINMARHFHDVRYLISRNDTAPLTFRSYLRWHIVLLCLEDRCLVEAYRRSMEAHIGEYDRWVVDTLRES